MSRSRIVALVVIVAAVALAVVVFDVTWGRALVAVLAAAVLLRIGWAMVSGLAQPVPEPPDPGELRKVKLTYRCAICGAEVRMTIAPQQDPEPPRHCLEDMDLVTPVEDR
jgi:hypothetical protein